MLPLLQTLQDRGGSARPRDLYGDIADQVGVTAEERSATVNIGGRKINAFERRVRWVRQTAVMRGLISKEESRVWRLTEAANAKLGNIQRGTILTFAISESGAFLWANAEDAVGVIEPGSVQLICTSPPYPLLSPKEYGNVPPDRWVGWLLELCEKWLGTLTPDGSLMLNIGSVFKEGVAAQQLHIERLLVKLEDELGVHLLQTLYWANPTKMPTPLNWVGIQRLRVTQSVEPLLWLSKNPMAYGNNRHCLRPYSPEGLRSIEKPRLKKRPSGFSFGAGSFRNQGGSIPPSLITATPTGKEEVRYRKAVRAAGRIPHPAILPAAVARFCIQLATNVGDTVYDPFSGSGTLVAESLKLGRKAIGSDRALEYLESSLIRCESENLQITRVLQL
jgi:site-specific DNA-methyltransferase (cytosine-N4-specific)